MGEINKKETLNDLNERYKECPIRISEYEINGKKYIVKSHFVGNKDLNKVLYNIAYNKAMSETLNAG